MKVPTAIPALVHFPKPAISMGTTLVAVQYYGGVVFGVDSRTSTGSIISNRVTDKITPLTEHIVCCRSGVAADTQAVADIVRFYNETYSIMEKKRLSVYRIVQLFRNFFYEYREQLTGSVIVGGFDPNEGAQIYEIPLGGFAIRRQFAATGSGSTFISGFIDQQWKPNLTLDETIKLVKTAVALATMRDGSSGGVIRIAIVNEKGTKRELIRPDSEEFPAVFTPETYSFLPKHVVDNQA